MEGPKWLRQSKDKPAFDDLLWSRPENKRYAGKLLIIGGNSHAFNAVSSAYAAALAAGIGTARVMLPDKLERMLSQMFPEAEFTSSSLSGSFARTALGPMCDAAAWADGVLLAGDFGKNSETAILLESFAGKYAGPLVLSGDSLDYFFEDPRPIIDRVQTVLVGSLSQVQKLLVGRALIKHSDDLVRIVELLAGFSKDAPSSVITHAAGQVIVAHGGQVSTTPAEQVDLIQLAAYASVWRLQQPTRPLEALTCGVYCWGSQEVKSDL